MVSTTESNNTGLNPNQVCKEPIHVPRQSSGMIISKQ